MKKRLLSAVVGIPAILILLFVASSFPFAIDIVLSVVSAICVGEALYAGKLLKKYFLSVPSILFGLSLPYIITTNYLKEAVYIYFLIALSSMIFFHKRISFSDVCVSFAFTIIISFGLSSIIPLFNIDRKFTVFYFVVGLAAPWLADSGAYFSGVFLGKHKLCPTISPKKTVEGAVGGVISGALLMLITGVVFDKLVFPCSEIVSEINYVNLFIISFICAIISILGDLTFSLFKRNFDAKDFGNIIPGHGGLLDRLDSVIFTFPALYILSGYLPLIK